ncbi:MAG TPA: site-2 protease family protein [Gemmataceae bacterium]|nr:site-2 protease family protein [Gemmataceae bacterium]
MPPSNPGSPMVGSIRLFRLAGVTVHLHWTWLIVAYIAVRYRADQYGSLVWNVAEYLALFGIVLLHEYGHALACRSVGGRADHIVLWPLGGIAFVAPPPRPGALLWSIVAGPLVNLVLVPVTFGILILAASMGLEESSPDAFRFVWSVTYINLLLLIFNMLPVYPLDGGQTLQALLWFVVGRARSLLIVSVIGLVVGVAVFVVAAVVYQDIWYMVLAGFVVLRSMDGFRVARSLAKVDDLSRRPEAVCPSCGANPPRGDLWVCGQCRTAFDTFEQRGVCPGCGATFPVTACPECHQASPIGRWFAEADRGR